MNCHDFLLRYKDIPNLALTYHEIVQCHDLLLKAQKLQIAKPTKSIDNKINALKYQIHFYYAINDAYYTFTKKYQNIAFKHYFSNLKLLFYQAKKDSFFYDTKLVYELFLDNTHSSANKWQKITKELTSDFFCLPNLDIFSFKDNLHNQNINSLNTILAYYDKIHHSIIFFTINFQTFNEVAFDFASLKAYAIQHCLFCVDTTFNYGFAYKFYTKNCFSDYFHSHSWLHSDASRISFSLKLNAINHTLNYLLYDLKNSKHALTTFIKTFKKIYSKDASFYALIQVVDFHYANQWNHQFDALSLSININQLKEKYNLHLLSINQLNVFYYQLSMKLFMLAHFFFLYQRYNYPFNSIDNLVQLNIELIANAFNQNQAYLCFKQNSSLATLLNTLIQDKTLT